MKITNLLLCFISLVSASPARGKLHVPNLFGDFMILQQNTRNAVWGFATAGEKITVEASWGARETTTADGQGEWKIMLQTPGAGTGHHLLLQGTNTIKINNVAIGEVWLCMGQSNMGWALKNTFGAEEEAAAANFPNFRIFKSSREHWHEPLKESRDLLAKWSPCNPAAAAAASAVAYYFGRKLHGELGVPVGIIVQAYAGTPIEGWMPKEIQADDPRTRAAMENYGKLSRRFSKEEALKNFAKELREYRTKIAAGETMKNKFKPLAPPTITRPALLGHQYPSHVFNAMVHPVRPYGIRGAIWYQGERNSKDVPQALNYRKQLAQLIRFYRSSWHKLSEGNVAADFPFYFTQLPSWNPSQEKPVEGIESPWAVNREMMRLVTADVANTAMAVSIDTGDAIALHPKNKKPIGTRHAYLALKEVYGKNIIASGPRFIKKSLQGNRIVLEFDSIGSGMMTARSGRLDAFAVAGKDRKWHWARAEITGNTVVLTAAQVPNPVAARYAWAMNPSQRNLLYNREGIPASPFRTDNWPLFDPQNDETLTVNKPEKPENYQSRDWTRPAMTQ
ncbi:MAG: sialate O-acetylesterase [Verrucomicrobiales bacterium]